MTDSADASAWVALPEDYFPDGYHQLAANATRRPVAGTNITLAVAALDDIHESKRQADRPKDREYLRQADAGGDG